MRIVVVSKRTSYRKIILEKGPNRKVVLRKQNASLVDRLRASHSAHESTVEEVLSYFAKEKIAITHLAGRPTRVPECDLLITVGGDGTLLHASHLISGSAAVLGINSAPQSSVGFFCAGEKGSVRRTLSLALEDKLARVSLNRMEVRLGERVLHQRVLNDVLFCHASPAATSRYFLEVDLGKASRQEEQKSSGLWVGPAAGSTSAQASAGGRVLPLRSKRIQYVVREPYSYGRTLRLRMGTAPETGCIRIRSKMQDARLFIDGDSLVHKVEFGDVVTLRRSEQPLVVLGLHR